MRIGTNELLIILVVVLLIFGPRPAEAGQDVRQAMNNFKKGMESPKRGRDHCQGRDQD